MLIAFAILLLPTLAFAQPSLEATQTQGFPASMTGGNTYSATYNIKSYSSSAIPIFFTLKLTTTTPIESSELNLVVNINGFVFTCTKSSDPYPRNWESWICMNGTDYYYFPAASPPWLPLFPSQKDLYLNLSLNLAASPQSNLNWEFNLWVQDQLPPEIILESPINGSVIKPGTLLNFSIRDNVKLSQAFSELRLFSDNFDDGNDLEWTHILGSWNVESGEYNQDSTLTNIHYFTTEGSAAWTNYLLEARIKVLSTYGTVNAPSVLVRFQDLDNFYMCQLRLDQNQLYIVKRVAGVWTLLGSKSFVVNTNEWHTLKCKVEGNQIFAYLHNSTHGISFNVTDSSLSSGRIGLNNYNTHTHFDNISVVSVAPLTDPYDIDTSAWTEGLHPLAIHAIDIVGNQNRSYFEFTIDNSAPRVENSTVNKTILKGENATVVVSVWDNVAVDKVIVEDNQTTNYTMQKVSNNYTVTIPNPSLGNHSLRYYANDTAGNVNNTVYDWFNVSLVAPSKVLSINITPSKTFDSTDYVKAGNITFNITFDKDMDVSVPLTVTYGKTTPFSNFSVVGGWADVRVWSGYSLINSATPNGNYTLNISGGKDLVGNLMIENTSTQFVIDTVSPTVVSFAMSDPSPTKAGNVTFNISFSQNMDQTIPLNVSFSLISSYTQHVISGNWTNSTLWSGYYNITPTTGDGLNVVKIAGGQDLAGNIMTANTSNTFLIDTITPVVRNATIPSMIYKTQDLTIMVEAFDTGIFGKIDKALVQINNTSPQNYSMSIAYSELANEKPYGFINKTTYYVIIPDTSLSVGNYSVRFYVNDTANNVNDSVTGSFVVGSTTNKTGGKIAFLCRDNPVGNNTTIIIDDSNPRFATTGAWNTYSNTCGYNGSYHYETTINPSDKARWTPAINTAGDYGVYIHYCVHSARPDAAPVTIYHNNQYNYTTVNQQLNATGQASGDFTASGWKYLGTYYFTTGSSQYVEINTSDTGDTCADAVKFESVLTCNYGIENQTIKWLREQGWTVNVKKYNAWTELELNSTDLMVCSDQTYACKPATNSPVYKEHKIYGKGFVEIPTTTSAMAGYTFGYLSKNSGLFTPVSTNVSIVAADPITSGYPISLQIFNSPQLIGAVMDSNLKSGSKDLVSPKTYSLASSLFTVNQSGTNGRYAYVGWFYGISFSFTSPWYSFYWFYGWTPYNLSSNGKELLIRSLNWAQCGNVIGCV